MPALPPAAEFLPRPGDGGRVFGLQARVRLGDVDRAGRLRLDATARYLQDVATDDANEVHLDRSFGWLVRRTAVRVVNPLVLGERIQVDTWCTALGRSWAERRSQLVGERGGCVDTVSLWVQIDVASGRPTRLAEDFIGAYGATAGGRTVSSRLGLDAPPDDLEAKPWSLRRVDFDPFGHINNAATWACVEEAAALDDGPRVGLAELEYPLAIEAGMDVQLRRIATTSSCSIWLSHSDTTLAAGRWTPAEC
ncbi:MAG: acyl-[acyl-carrier-protein] thioesterase [Ilumatobacter sp.]